MIDLKSVQFKTLADPIYLGGHKIDEIWKGNVKIYPEIGDVFKVRMPCIISYDGCIHIFGGYNRDGPSAGWSQMHIKWDGTSWIRVGKIPFAIENDRCVVYNGCIYAIADCDSEYKFDRRTVYKYDGYTWSLVSDKSDLPKGVYYSTSDEYFDTYLDTLFSLNGSLYAVGRWSNNIYALLEWTGSNWIWVNYDGWPNPRISAATQSSLCSICTNDAHLFYNGYDRWIFGYVGHVTWNGGETIDHHDKLPTAVDYWFEDLYFMVKDTIYYLYLNGIYRLNSDDTWDLFSKVPFNDTGLLESIYSYGTVHNDTFHIFNTYDGSHWMYSQQESKWIQLPDIII